MNFLLPLPLNERIQAAHFSAPAGQKGVPPSGEKIDYPVKGSCLRLYYGLFLQRTGENYEFHSHAHR